mmetsp:Transcript_20816/g.52460  ORF Transcript_20816/g.52460 Transcript_20816/m.52460 type:complete len:271 (-) Transcript_20816:5-817(-)
MHQMSEASPVKIPHRAGSPMMWSLRVLHSSPACRAREQRRTYRRRCPDRKGRTQPIISSDRTAVCRTRCFPATRQYCLVFRPSHPDPSADLHQTPASSPSPPRRWNFLAASAWPSPWSFRRQFARLRRRPSSARSLENSCSKIVENPCATIAEKSNSCFLTRSFRRGAASADQSWPSGSHPNRNPQRRCCDPSTLRARVAMQRRSYQISTDTQRNGRFAEQRNKSQSLVGEIQFIFLCTYFVSAAITPRHPTRRSTKLGHKGGDAYLDRS